MVSCSFEVLASLEPRLVSFLLYLGWFLSFFLSVKLNGLDINNTSVGFHNNLLPTASVCFFSIRFGLHNLNLCFIRVGLESRLVNLWAITVLVSDWLIPGPSRWWVSSDLRYSLLYPGGFRKSVG